MKKKKKKKGEIVKIVTSYVCLRCSLKSKKMLVVGLKKRKRKMNNCRMINSMCAANRVEK